MSKTILTTTLCGFLCYLKLQIDYTFQASFLIFLWINSELDGFKLWPHLPYTKFVIISDRKNMSSQLLFSLSVLDFTFKHIFLPIFQILSRFSASRYTNVFSILPFLTSNNFVCIRTGRFLLWFLDSAFKPTKKLVHDILSFLNKSKTLGSDGFPLGNLQYVPIVDA
jgi:hypothetical protein